MAKISNIDSLNLLHLLLATRRTRSIHCVCGTGQHQDRGNCDFQFVTTASIKIVLQCIVSVLLYNNVTVIIMLCTYHSILVIISLGGEQPYRWFLGEEQIWRHASHLHRGKFGSFTWEFASASTNAINCSTTCVFVIRYHCHYLNL